jgi:hypothetical protein
MALEAEAAAHHARGVMSPRDSHWIIAPDVFVEGAAPWLCDCSGVGMLLRGEAGTAVALDTARIT